MDEYYNQIAEGYDELYEEEQKAKLELARSGMEELGIKINPDERLLDVGCGSGISTRFWEYSEADKTGIDPSEKLIALAQTKDIMSQYFVECAEDIPFDDALFDIVISITAIQNFNSIAKGVQEMARVAKEHLVISYLKKSEKSGEIRKEISESMDILKEIEENNDIILICRKRQ